VGDWRELIFQDDADRQRFIETLPKECIRPMSAASIWF